MDWSGVDYLWIIVMFLSDVWTLILTAPIHCSGSIGEQVMECYISPNLFWWTNKLINILWWVHFQQLFIFAWTIPLTHRGLHKSISQDLLDPNYLFTHLFIQLFVCTLSIIQIRSDLVLSRGQKAQLFCESGITVSEYTVCCFSLFFWMAFISESIYLD